MATVKARLAPDGAATQILPDGAELRIAAKTDWAAVDATSEADIARQAAEDDQAARADAAAYAARVRGKLGLSQTAFARTLNVSVATVRNWEQGRRHPEGAARTLLRLIDRAPEAVLAALKSAPETQRPG